MARNRIEFRPSADPLPNHHWIMCELCACMEYNLFHFLPRRGDGTQRERKKSFHSVALTGWMVSVCLSFSDVL